jgi:hypothetical protein
VGAEAHTGPDWLAIDQVLGPGFRAYRDECAALLGFADAGAWARIPMLCQLSQDVAIVQLAMRIQKAKGLGSWRSALTEAEYELLGVEIDLDRQLRRWRSSGQLVPPGT